MILRYVFALRWRNRYRVRDINMTPVACHVGIRVQYIHYVPVVQHRFVVVSLTLWQCMRDYISRIPHNHRYMRACVSVRMSGYAPGIDTREFRPCRYYLQAALRFTDERKRKAIHVRLHERHMASAHRQTDSHSTCNINNADHPKMSRDTHPVSLDNFFFAFFSLFFRSSHFLFSQRQRKMPLWRRSMHSLIFICFALCSCLFVVVSLRRRVFCS